MSPLTDAYRAHQEQQAGIVATKAALVTAIETERAAGKSWDAIGGELGLSRQRAYEIVHRR